jgi:hypothetical protein
MDECLAHWSGEQYRYAALGTSRVSVSDLRSLDFVHFRYYDGTHAEHLR